MIGQGFAIVRGQGVLNPERGKSAEADLPFAQDSLDRLGLRRTLGGVFAVPWAYTRAAYGIQKGYEHNMTRTTRWGYGDALSNVSNIASEVQTAQIPTFIIQVQLPMNSRSLQDRRLPISMVAPQLAWRPG